LGAGDVGEALGALGALGSLASFCFAGLLLPALLLLARFLAPPAAARAGAGLAAFFVPLLRDMPLLLTLLPMPGMKPAVIYRLDMLSRRRHH
jgi:hypothetical protein